MNLERFRTDDKAVSPVIGVILMVAITVILAAVIASFVLGLGQQNPGVTTQASFDFDHEQNSGAADAVFITHDSGDSLDASNVYVRGDHTEGGDLDWETLSGGDTEASAGSTAEVEVDLDEEDFEIRVVFENEDGSNTLQTFESTSTTNS